MLRALLLAPPGAGKGTQGDRLAAAYDVEHLATGDLLRRHVAKGTPIGRLAEAAMAVGDLVPDQLVVDLVIDHIAGLAAGAGYLLDGFPRTLEQAEAAYAWAADRGRTFNAVVHLDVPADELVRRLLERGRRQGRADDNEVTIAERLAVYQHQTVPLLDFYAGRRLLVTVDGTGAVEAVFDRVVTGLTALGHPPAAA